VGCSRRPATAWVAASSPPTRARTDESLCCSDAVLTELMAGARADAAARRESTSRDLVESRALSAPPALDALKALAPADTVKVIAEIKRASPSRGMMADIPEPAKLARLYELGGASAVSVLTEQRRFGGSLAD